MQRQTLGIGSSVRFGLLAGGQRASLVNYRFEWDPAKAKANQRKHGVSFQKAATIFTDPNQISIFDDEHSDSETRWVTIGADNAGNLLVVVHTYRANADGDAGIRLISARRANRREVEQYTGRRA